MIHIFPSYFCHFEQSGNKLHIISPLPKHFSLEMGWERDFGPLFCVTSYIVLRASPAVLSMSSCCTVKLDEEKSKMPVWVRRIVLAPHNLTVCRWLVQGPQPTCAPAQKSVINMIWLLLTHCFRSPRLIMMIGPSGLLLVVPPRPLAYLLFEFQFWWVGLQEKYITKLGCENIFLQAHILSTTGDALIL
jgi:hypothetical protein